MQRFPNLKHQWLGLNLTKPKKASEATSISFIASFDQGNSTFILSYQLIVVWHDDFIFYFLYFSSIHCAVRIKFGEEEAPGAGIKIEEAMKDAITTKTNNFPSSWSIRKKILPLVTIWFYSATLSSIHILVFVVKTYGDGGYNHEA